MWIALKLFVNAVDMLFINCYWHWMTVLQCLTASAFTLSTDMTRLSQWLVIRSTFVYDTCEPIYTVLILLYVALSHASCTWDFFVFWIIICNNYDYRQPPNAPLSTCDFTAQFEQWLQQQSISVKCLVYTVPQKTSHALLCLITLANVDHMLIILSLSQSQMKCR